MPHRHFCCFIIPYQDLTKVDPGLAQSCLRGALLKPYQTDTWGLFNSYIGHICTKCSIYLTNISPIYHKSQGHISVIWIWEKCEIFRSPPPVIVYKRKIQGTLYGHNTLPSLGPTPALVPKCHLKWLLKFPSLFQAVCTISTFLYSQAPLPMLEDFFVNVLLYPGSGDPIIIF